MCPLRSGGKKLNLKLKHIVAKHSPANICHA